MGASPMRLWVPRVRRRRVHYSSGMKLTEDLERAFDAQITLEFESSLVYRQLAIEMAAQDLPGMAVWLQQQAAEELTHADRFIEHMLDRGNHPRVGALSSPDVKQGPSPLEVFQSALGHEERVSESIRELVRAADRTGDLDSRPLLNWFLSEQIEEEATVSEIVARITLIGNDGPGLLRLDSELASRGPGGAPAVTTT